MHRFKGHTVRMSLTPDSEQNAKTAPTGPKTGRGRNANVAPIDAGQMVTMLATLAGALAFLAVVALFSAPLPPLGMALALLIGALTAAGGAVYAHTLRK